MGQVAGDEDVPRVLRVADGGVDHEGDVGAEVRRAALVSAISHEFRTPLTVIGSALDMVADERVDRETAARLAMSARRQVRRLERLVNGVLAATGADEDQEEEVLAVGALRDFVLDRLHDDEHGRVVLDLPATESVVSVQTRLGSALGLLVEQAVRQAGPSGEVRVAAHRTDGGVEFVVNDLEGDEETAADADLDFVARLELDRGQAGTGLGLFTTDQIARRLGGRLRVAHDGPRIAASLFVPQRRSTDEPGQQRPRLGDAPELI